VFSTPWFKTALESIHTSAEDETWPYVAARLGAIVDVGDLTKLDKRAPMKFFGKLCVELIVVKGQNLTQWRETGQLTGKWSQSLSLPA
jgi:hypothetical protein